MRARGIATMAPLKGDGNVVACSIATTAPLKGGESMVLIIRNTFIEARRPCDDSKRSSSVPRAMNWNFPGDNRRLGSFPVDAGDKGKHGEQQTPSTKSPIMPDGQPPLSAQAPQAGSSTKSQNMPAGQHPLSVLAPQAFLQSWPISSQEHDEGSCKPCAWLWKNGCLRGSSCGYCHLCGIGELKARRKQKTRLLKDREKQQRQLVQTFPTSSGQLMDISSTSSGSQDDGQLMDISPTSSGSQDDGIRFIG